MCVHCRTQFFIKEFSAAIRTLPVRHHGHLKKWSSNFLVFFVVLVVIELSEKNNAHVQFGHDRRANLVSSGETSMNVLSNWCKQYNFAHLRHICHTTMMPMTKMTA